MKEVIYDIGFNHLYSNVSQQDLIEYAIQQIIVYGVMAKIDDEIDFYDSYSDLVDSAIADALDHYRRELLAPLHQHIKAQFDEGSRSKQLKDIVIEATKQQHNQIQKEELQND